MSQIHIVKSSTDPSLRRHQSIVLRLLLVLAGGGTIFLTGLISLAPALYVQTGLPLPSWLVLTLPLSLMLFGAGVSGGMLLIWIGLHL